MEKSKKHRIYRKRWFFYRGALIQKAPEKVAWMSRVSGTSEDKKLQATVFKPFIVYVSRVQTMTHRWLTHEVIHTRQILDCMLIGFFLGLYFGLPWWGMSLLFLAGIPGWWAIYILEFILLRSVLRSHHDAYLLISCEQEAYLMEDKKYYLYLRFPGLWFVFMLGNILLLWFRWYRIPLLRKILHVRTCRKQYDFWSEKFKKKQNV